MSSLRWLEMCSGPHGAIYTRTHTHALTHKILYPLSLTPFLPSLSLRPQSMRPKESNSKAIKQCMGSAVGMLLALNCYICRHRSCRQQPSHLSVINPYSPLAAFLPFTTYCLKLKRKKRRVEGKALKLQS